MEKYKKIEQKIKFKGFVEFFNFFSTYTLNNPRVLVKWSLASLLPWSSTWDYFYMKYYIYLFKFYIFLLEITILVKTCSDLEAYLGLYQISMMKLFWWNIFMIDVPKISLQTNSSYCERTCIPFTNYPEKWKMRTGKISETLLLCKI